jgi:putative nucleotidyltransferase with HDIG domain
MSSTETDFYVLPEQLCIGLYVHIDLPWFSHPFSFSSFKIRSQDQIRQLRALKVKRFRCDPDQSDNNPYATAQEAPAADIPQPEPAQCEAESADPALATKREQIARLEARRVQVAQVERAFTKAAAIMRNVNRNLFATPKECLEEVGELVGQMVHAFLEQPEATLHAIGEKAGGDEIYYHGLNTAVLSMMLAKDLGLSTAQARVLGVGALFHDLGHTDIPDKVLRKKEELTHAETELCRLHCEYGVRRGRQLSLPPEALVVIAQHHELADGSGYPGRLQGEALHPMARIVALVNHYDNLCNPVDVQRALTPHEALSLIYAKGRNKFDNKVLQVMVRRLGVYPPGTLVKLSNDALALVSSVNERKPLRPWVVLYDASVPKDEAIMLDLEHEPEISISKALRPAQLPPQVLEYLSPRRRVTYYFDASGLDGGT